jgi:hypothetical protein
MEIPLIDRLQKFCWWAAATGGVTGLTAKTWIATHPTAMSAAVITTDLYWIKWGSLTAAEYLYLASILLFLLSLPTIALLDRAKKRIR